MPRKVTEALAKLHDVGVCHSSMLSAQPWALTWPICATDFCPANIRPDLDENSYHVSIIDFGEAFDTTTTISLLQRRGIPGDTQPLTRFTISIRTQVENGYLALGVSALPTRTGHQAFRLDANGRDTGSTGIQSSLNLRGSRHRKHAVEITLQIFDCFV